jgi:hypothetical protein
VQSPYFVPILCLCFVPKFGFILFWFISFVAVLFIQFFLFLLVIFHIFLGFCCLCMLTESMCMHFIISHLVSAVCVCFQFHVPVICICFCLFFMFKSFSWFLFLGHACLGSFLPILVPIVPPLVPTYRPKLFRPVFFLSHRKPRRYPLVILEVLRVFLKGANSPKYAIKMN